jgi:hypothetical protein
MTDEKLQKAISLKEQIEAFKTQELRTRVVLSVDIHVPDHLKPKVLEIKGPAEQAILKLLVSELQRLEKEYAAL